MLQEIAKKDKLWRLYAFNLCKCKHLADDIVQDTYLRLLRNPRDKMTDSFIRFAIKSVWLNHLKTKKRNISLEQMYYIESKENTFEADDAEQTMLERYDRLEWHQKELIAEIYDRSLREIETKYPLINYAFAFRQIKEARELILKK